jgi:hypothetical protein
MRSDRGGPLDATLVESSAPRELATGEAAAGHVTLRNTGTEAWTEAFSLGVRAGRALGPSRVSIPPGTVVRPGDTLSLAIPYAAPAGAGYYMLEWSLADASGVWFGDAAVEGILVRGRGGKI